MTLARYCFGSEGGLTETPLPPAAAPPAVAAPPPAPPAAASGAAADGSADAATVVKPEMVPVAAPLAEIRLVGSDYDLVVITTPGAHVLGRAADAPLRVKHATVSRTHARVILSEDRQTASLEHAGGANGTRLNGRPIDKPEPLSDGDEIGVGEVTSA